MKPRGKGRDTGVEGSQKGRGGRGRGRGKGGGRREEKGEAATKFPNPKFCKRACRKRSAATPHMIGRGEAATDGFFEKYEKERMRAEGKERR